MQKYFLLPTLIFILAGCGSSSKKLVNLPPRAADAPVQIFWEQPNIKYEKICEITSKGNNSLLPNAYRTREDFKSMFESEARKCGADAVIFSMLSGFSNGDVTAYATGIKIISKPAEVTDSDKVKSFSLAIQSHNAKLVREILTSVSKEKANRAPSDDYLVNTGLYIASLDGFSCDLKIIKILENEYNAHIEKYKAVDLYNLDRPDSNTPLCNDVMARSLTFLENKTDAILQSHNYYVQVLNNPSDRLFNKKLAAFNKLLVEASKIIAQECAKSAVSSICSLKESFVSTANKTISGKDLLKKNSQDVLKILK